MKMLLVQILEIFRKDLLIEWRGKARFVALAVFAATILLMMSFAIGPNSEQLRAHDSGYIWIAVLLASTQLLAGSFHTETEGGALEGLRLLPVFPPSLFYGKALANWVFLVLLVVLILPLSGALFDLGIQGSWLHLALVILLGTAGVAAPGTLYAALTARAPAQQLMLPLLLFPLLVPTLLAAVKVTGLVILGDPMGQTAGWLFLLTCFDVVFWMFGGVLFWKLVES
jgi:heme exporter protein B